MKANITFFCFLLCLNAYSQCLNNLSPPNGSVVYKDSVVLNWSGNCACFGWCSGQNCSTSHSYTITFRVATDSLMNNTVHSVTINIFSNYHTIPGNVLQNNTTYWWKATYYHSWYCYGGTNCSGSWYCACGSCSSTKFRTNFAPIAPSNLNALAVSSSRINLNWADSSSTETGFKILRSDDFGKSWFLRDSTLTNIVTYSDSGLTANRVYYYSVYAYNNYGNSPYSNMAYDTTFNSIGINIINSEIPADFKLSNNYPNPFNPNTKFSFALPKNIFTRLVIYDVLGREVETFVNQELKPGTYEVDFEGTNYPSGVYYYRLSAGGYVNTKKMILLK